MNTTQHYDVITAPYHVIFVYIYGLCHFMWQIFSSFRECVTNSDIWFVLKNVDLTPAKNSKPSPILVIDVFNTG